MMELPLDQVAVSYTHLLDRTDGATNSNLIYNGFPNHHGPAEAWQVGMLYNLVYNRD